MTKKGWIVASLWAIGALAWTYSAVSNFVRGDSLSVFLGAVDCLIVVLCALNSLMTVRKEKFDRRIRELEDRFAQVREGTE